MFAKVPQGDTIILKVRIHSKHLLYASNLIVKVVTLNFSVLDDIVVGCMPQLVRWKMHRISKELSQSIVSKWEGDCGGVHIARRTRTNWRIPACFHSWQPHVYHCWWKGKNSETIWDFVQALWIFKFSSCLSRLL